MIRIKNQLKMSKAILLLTFLAFTFNSCKKFVQIDPPSTELITKTVYEDDATATSAVVSIYSNFMNTILGMGSGAITLYTGLSGDEFLNYSSDLHQIEFYTNSLTAQNSVIKSLWSEAYNRIYVANSVIEGLDNSANVSTNVKSQLKGEAKFIRAFCYFYLINLFGDVPYITSTDYHVNAIAPRISKDQIYQRIVEDLKDAQGLLIDNYVSATNAPTTERVRPNKWTATALLARVYLYTNDWANAEIEATSIINNVSQYSLVNDLNEVFSKNSAESIWQLAPVSAPINTWEGYYFILTTSPTNVALNVSLVNSFNAGDNRRINWVDSIIVGANTYYFPSKYKIKTNDAFIEYYTVFRLAEQYLIRAEARAQQDNILGAKSDLNAIRNRSGLGNILASDKESVLQAIEQERRAELFTEWGHRWFDLKRTNRINDVLAPIKGSNWQSTDTLYPIPQSQIQTVPNTPQNPGYE